VPDSTTDQLAAIADLAAALDERGVDYWLFGGWAVDFWVGDVTREHGDVDVAAWRHDYDAIKAVMVAAGWRHTPDADEPFAARYRRRATLVEFTFVVTDSAGRVLLPMAEPPVLWWPEPFGDSRRELHGVSSRVVPLSALKAGKSVPREDPADAAKDRADFDALGTVPDAG